MDYKLYATTSHLFLKGHRLYEENMKMNRKGNSLHRPEEHAQGRTRRRRRPKTSPCLLKRHLALRIADIIDI